MSAQPQPVAWAIFSPNGNCRMWTQVKDHAVAASNDTGLPLVPLYTHPAQCLQQSEPGRVMLTHLQAKALVDKYGIDPLHLIFQVEAAHHITSKPESAL